MAENHQPVDKVGAYEASTTCDEDTFALCWGEKLYRGEAGEGGVRDGLCVGMIDGFGLVRPEAANEPGV